MAPELRAGDLILTSEKSFTSWVVRAITGCQYSHVGIYGGDGNYISAHPVHGVCSVPFEGIQEYAQFRVTGLTPQQRAAVVAFCTARIGKTYDYVQILVLFWRIITDSLMTAEGDMCPDSYVCSELVAEAYASIGVNFGRVVDNVLPGTIIRSERTIRIS